MAIRPSKVKVKLKLKHKTLKAASSYGIQEASTKKWTEMKEILIN